MINDAIIKAGRPDT